MRGLTFRERIEEIRGSTGFAFFLIALGIISPMVIGLAMHPPKPKPIDIRCVPHDNMNPKASIIIHPLHCKDGKYIPPTRGE